jgi:lysophospholipase L1-like esterase
VDLTKVPYFVGIVGDSWVAGGKLDDGIRKAFYDAGLDTIVRSRCFPGATTDAVLHALETNLLPYATKNYPERSRIILIGGGVNDAIQHRGMAHYVENMRTMAARTVMHGALPVVLSIPPFRRTALRASLPSRVLWTIRRRISHEDLDNGGAYSAAMVGAIGAVPTIDLHPLVSPDDYQDGVHLTAKGYDRLAEKLGRILLDTCVT